MPGMTFQEARDIARARPGAVLTRDEFGDLIVRLPDGSVLTDAPGGDTGDTVRALRSRLNRVLREHREIQIEMEAEKHKRTELQSDFDRLSRKMVVLEEKIADVPDDVWQELEKRKQAKNANERTRLLALVSSGTLSYKRIQAIWDHASDLGFSSQEVQIIDAELERQRVCESSSPSPSVFVVHATTDGQ